MSKHLTFYDPCQKLPRNDHALSFCSLKESFDHAKGIRYSGADEKVYSETLLKVQNVLGIRWASVTSIIFKVPSIWAFFCTSTPNTVTSKILGICWASVSVLLTARRCLKSIKRACLVTGKISYAKSLFESICWDPPDNLEYSQIWWAFKSFCWFEGTLWSNSWPAEIVLLQSNNCTMHNFNGQAFAETMSRLATNAPCLVSQKPFFFLLPDPVCRMNLKAEAGCLRDLADF